MLTIFFHVPRTGGTSFRLYAEKVLGKNKAEILGIYGTDLNNTIKNLVNGIATSGGRCPYELVRGHITTACLRRMPSVLAITILRNPVERVASLYRYIKGSGDHPIHNEVVKMSLIDFCNSGISLEANDGMVRQLCGSEPELPQGPYSKKAFPEHTPYGDTRVEMLRESLAILNDFTVVGVLENMDVTMQMVYKATGWAKIPIGKANATGKQELTQAEVEYLQGLNTLDERLWMWARDRLEEEARWL